MNKVNYINDNEFTSKDINIPDKIINIMTNINETLFKYVKENYYNINIIETKLVLINNKINEVLEMNAKKNKSIISKNKKVLFKSFSSNNLLNNTDKSNNNKFNNNIKHSINNNNIKNINNSNIIKEIDSNKYLTFKLKKKLKQEHNKNKLKELDYLERIAVLQCKLSLYEKNFEKLIIDNINNKKFRANLNLNYYFKNQKSGYKNERNLIRPLSSTTIDTKISNLKKHFKKYVENKNNNNSISETYITANMNSLESYLSKNKKNNYCNSNYLHYKYEIGNNYIKNDFRRIKKTIHENNTKITKLTKLMNKCEF